MTQTEHSVLTPAEKESVKILRTWELPPVLKGISGIAYLDSDQIVCVQREIGSIFIYNLRSKKIVAQIPFGPAGNYQGIALVNEDAYIACADGRLLEIAKYRSATPTVTEYGTHLTIKQNAAGVCYDKQYKRLLVVINGPEEGAELYKGIYSFDLATKKMAVKPAFRINLQDSLFSRFQLKTMQNAILPSEISVNPSNGDIYVLDGTRAQLLIIESAGALKSLVELNKYLIRPEGMMFTPSGELFVSSEEAQSQSSLLTLLQVSSK